MASKHSYAHTIMRPGPFHPPRWAVVTGGLESAQQHASKLAVRRGFKQLNSTGDGSDSSGGARARLRLRALVRSLEVLSIPCSHEPLTAAGAGDGSGADAPGSSGADGPGSSGADGPGSSQPFLPAGGRPVAPLGTATSLLQDAAPLLMPAARAVLVASVLDSSGLGAMPGDERGGGGSSSSNHRGRAWVYSHVLRAAQAYRTQVCLRQDTAARRKGCCGGAAVEWRVEASSPKVATKARPVDGALLQQQGRPACRDREVLSHCMCVMYTAMTVCGVPRCTRGTRNCICGSLVLLHHVVLRSCIPCARSLPHFDAARSSQCLPPCVRAWLDAGPGA